MTRPKSNASRNKRQCNGPQPFITAYPNEMMEDRGRKYTLHRIVPNEEVVAPGNEEDLFCKNDTE